VTVLPEVFTVVEVDVLVPAGVPVPPHATINMVAALQSSRMITILLINMFAPYRQRKWL
jgi:hypothetical protein